MSTIYLILGADDVEIARAYSRTASVRIAANKLGSAVGVKKALGALACGKTAWLHASKSEGCASLQIVPTCHG